ncbi:hypothetical protein TRFO_12105 [Tritrichomonas foetus]|uniref:Thioredoxin family protein n=1 Tax=Tritrichomonas foetus TaxID=1144522 RepID=A0A1J4J2W3_9EUKA|nr:hypothetical protein TRFO_12105 [Tritrichomonas foetus]|eukprot:OHS93081.1 hypothetical protein TRFO_12105 [Tritrichomonas foetus]
MAKLLREGQINSIIKSSGKKLVAVDFSNPGCPPCRAIKPWWDSLPAKYPTVEFCTIMCQDCPGDAQAHSISGTPTFVFFQNGHEITRIVGPNKSQILSTIEKYKTTSSFSGKARTLGDSSSTHPPQQNQPHHAQQQQTQPPPMIDNFTQNMLLEMGFPPSSVTKALAATSNGTVDQCVLYLEKLQNQEKNAIDGTTQELLQMGFDQIVVKAAIEKVGPHSIEKCLDEIEKMTNSSNNTDNQAKINELKAKLAAKNEQENHQKPISQAQEELKRRQEVKDSLKLREEVKERRNDVELSEFEKRRRQEILEKKEILQRIKTQHSTNTTSATNGESAPKKTQSHPASEKRECTLKMIFPDGNTLINKFQSTETIADVAAFIASNVPEARRKTIGIETMFPRRILTNSDFALTLTECQLVPRAQVNVLYL